MIYEVTLNTADCLTNYIALNPTPLIEYSVFEISHAGETDSYYTNMLNTSHPLLSLGTLDPATSITTYSS